MSSKQLANFKYQSLDDKKMKQRNREVVRGGFYGYDLWDHQKKAVEALPEAGSTYLFEAPIGFGKTRMMAKIAEDNFKKNEEHTVCLIVTANASQQKSQMKEFGDVNQKAYTQTMDSDSKKNLVAWNLKNTVHPTITVTPQMFSRILGEGTKKRSKKDDDDGVLNQLRFISELGPDTRNLVIIIDEVHDLYSSKYGKNKKAVKNSPTWHALFAKHHINVTMIGATATLNLQEDFAIQNACRLFGVDGEEQITGMIHFASDDACKAHTEKVQGSGAAKVAPKVINRKLAKNPSQVNCDLSLLLGELEILIVGSEVVRHLPNFTDDVIPACQRDLAFKNCVTEICLAMMMEDDHIEKPMGVRKLVDARRMTKDGTWEDAKMYPNAVIFFQTDRMRQAYQKEVLRRNEDEDEVHVHCIEMPPTPTDADEALELFNENRIYSEEDQKDDIPCIVICPSRVFRKGSNAFVRYPPSTVICVGNYTKSELRQMHGRFGRYNEKYMEGDLVPVDPIKVVNIPLGWADSMIEKITALRERKRASARNIKNNAELKELYGKFCDMERDDDEDELDCRAVKVSADILQTISEMDVPTKERNVGIEFLNTIMDTSTERQRLIRSTAFFNTVRKHTTNSTAEEWEEDDHCFDQGLSVFAEQDVPDLPDLPDLPDPSDLPESTPPGTSAAGPSDLSVIGEAEEVLLCN